MYHSKEDIIIKRDMLFDRIITNEAFFTYVTLMLKLPCDRKKYYLSYDQLLFEWNDKEQNYWLKYYFINGIKELSEKMYLKLLSISKRGCVVQYNWFKLSGLPNDNPTYSDWKNTVKIRYDDYTKIILSNSKKKMELLRFFAILIDSLDSTEDYYEALFPFGHDIENDVMVGTLSQTELMHRANISIQSLKRYFIWCMQSKMIYIQNNEASKVDESFVALTKCYGRYEFKDEIIAIQKLRETRYLSSQIKVDSSRSDGVSRQALKTAYNKLFEEGRSYTKEKYLIVYSACKNSQLQSRGKIKAYKDFIQNAAISEQEYNRMVKLETNKQSYYDLKKLAKRYKELFGSDIVDDIKKSELINELKGGGKK